MVGGRDYNTRPFNLATQGQRQPGSAIKPFILAEALRRGISPASVWPSRKRVFQVPGGSDKFTVNNFENSYSGTNTLAGALTASDNSIFAAVGLQVGTKRIARLVRQMGIRTPVSSNPAMTLGGLKQGVTPLDMAHAYETFADNGLRVYGSLGASKQGPVGIRAVSTLPRPGRTPVVLAKNKIRRRRVLTKDISQQTVGIMQTVITRGTGKRAGLADGTFAAGKTGTTENSGDAWFVGFTDRLTVAVWVGYPGQAQADADRVRGPPGRGRHVPGADLARLHDRREQDHRRPRRARAGPQGPAAGGPDQAADDDDRPGAADRGRAAGAGRGRRRPRPAERAGGVLGRRDDRAQGDAGARPDAHSGADPHPGAGAHADAGPRADADPHAHADAHAADRRHPARGGRRCRARLTRGIARGVGRNRAI